MKRHAILALGLGLASGCGRIAGTLPMTANMLAETEHGPARAGVLELRWRRQLVDTMTWDWHPTYHGAPAFDPVSNRLYVGTIDHGMCALRASDGAIIWRFETLDRADSAPTLDDDRLFFGSADGAMYAIDARTGEMKWRHATQASIEKPAVIADNTVFFVNGNDTVFAVNRSDGQLRWRFRREAPNGVTLTGHAGLLKVGTKIYTGFSDGYVACLNAADGTEIWHSDTASYLENLDERNEAHQAIDVDTTPVRIGNTVYVASYSAGVFALDAEGGHQQWRLESVTQVSALGTDGRYLYAASAHDGLIKLDPFDGSILWSRDLGTHGMVSIDAVNSSLITVATLDQALWVVRTSDGEPIDGVQPGFGFGAGPIIDHGRLFITSNGGVIYSFLLRPPTLAIP